MDGRRCSPLSLSDFSQVNLSDYLSKFHIDYWTRAELRICHSSALSSPIGRLGCYVLSSLSSMQLGIKLYWPMQSEEPMLWPSPTALASWKDVQHAFISSLEKCIWTRTKSLKMKNVDLISRRGNSTLQSHHPLICAVPQCLIREREAPIWGANNISWVLRSLKHFAVLAWKVALHICAINQYSIIPHSWLKSDLGLGD